MAGSWKSTAEFRDNCGYYVNPSLGMRTRRVCIPNPKQLHDGFANSHSCPPLCVYSLKAGKVVIVLNGRMAGKKGLIVKTFDEGTDGRKYGHAIVAGIARAPLKVKKSMGEKKVEKRSRVKPFLKLVNFNHLMPTRLVFLDPHLYIPCCPLFAARATHHNARPRIFYVRGAATATAVLRVVGDASSAGSTMMVMQRRMCISVS